MKQRKILLFANTDWYLYNFRRSLAEKLRSQGWEVVLVSPPGEYGPKMQALGFRWIPFDFSTRSINPFNELAVIYRLIRIYRSERPSLAHHFTIKCVLYGSMAARFAGKFPVVNSVTGLGHIFTDSGKKARILRPLINLLYRFVFGNHNGRVIFQNSQDLNSFVTSGIVRKSRARLIRGSGVNTELFRPSFSDSQKERDIVSVLFASRILREKGVFEFLEAAQILKDHGVKSHFMLAGDIYPGNPSSLSDDEIAKIKHEGFVNYLGHVDNMMNLLSDSDIVVLPSYREGTPRILIEAAAMEKPIVATDIAGCVGIVEHGVNGLLVPVNDTRSLAKAIEKLIMDPELRIKLGKAGREIVISEFDENIVLKKTLAVYEELTGEEQ